ncbi:MAG: putative fluoride ion transporter CrcB [Burkholderiaceae bacterium]|nr:putative fluoride ion transporter CrcB [Burkholderiaceae bacterium]
MSASGAWGEAAAVAAGAAIGALGRWGAGVWLNARWPGFPLGTLFVNLLGGLLMGVALVWLQEREYGALRLFAMTGVLGGFTTFSAFSAESLTLLERGQLMMAATHTLAHVLGALACAALGVVLARALAG